jgi:hypothetical protein
LKDRRYNALKAYIESGDIKSFTEIFDIVPRSVIVRDSGINFVRLTNKIQGPEKFTVKDILILGQLIGVDSGKLYNLISAGVDKKLLKKKA